MMAEVYIHCKDSYEKMSLEEAATNPIGSGSYRLASWDRGSQIVLEKVKDPGTFERIIWRIIPEASTRSAELIAGNVDIITNVAPDQIDAINDSRLGQGRGRSQGTRRIRSASIWARSSPACRAARRSRTRRCAAPCNMQSTCRASAASCWTSSARA